jgi:hypothetical protein
MARSVDSPNACIYAEIRTRIPDTVSWDYNFEPTGNIPVSFTVKVILCNYVLVLLDIDLYVLEMSPDLNIFGYVGGATHS